MILPGMDEENRRVKDFNTPMVSTPDSKGLSGANPEFLNRGAQTRDRA